MSVPNQSPVTSHFSQSTSPLGYPTNLFAGKETFEGVNETIGSVVLRDRQPRPWWIGFIIAFALLMVLFLAISWLLIRGVGIWGINIPVAWGYAIVNFVWWIGIAHAGTFISAILLLMFQHWRTAINRFSEAMTLFAIACAGMFPLLHLGRPWVFYWLFPYPDTMKMWPQFRSPLVWDVFAVGTYFTVSLLFWYLGLVPDLATVRDRIQQLPQTDEVQVVRKLPGEIDIRVVERKPVAWITSEKEISDPFASDAAFLVDARGVLMKQKKLLPEYLGLPLILGCSSEALEVGKVVESLEAKTALELLRLSARSFFQMRFQIREIDVSKGYCLLVTDKNRARVTFGFNDLQTQLRRLEQFLVYCDDSKQELGTVNLLVQRNIPVTFAEAPAAVINDTIEPAVEPRIMKAIPVHAPEKAVPAAPKPRAGSTPSNKTIPVIDRKRINKNG